MGLIGEIQRIFCIENLTVLERMKIVEISFEVEAKSLPTFAEIEKLLSLIPDRDVLKIDLISDSEEIFVIMSSNKFSGDDYQTFCRELDSESYLRISISIDKNVVDCTFSIYNFKSFAEDILESDITQVMAGFSILMRNCNYLVFDLFDQNLFFTTTSMAFVSGNRTSFSSKLQRSKRLISCKETTYFYNVNDYNLLPDDFFIEINYEDNPLTDLFNRICTILSLAYISSSSSIVENYLKIQISGQRNIDFSYQLINLKNNIELFKIYSWIYTDGSSIDKGIIARNIISLHCKYSDLINIDEKTFSSIQSNYNLYLKNNVTQYLDLKNKLADFICNVVSKTGDYATSLLASFKTNLIAIFGFLFTVILANIVSDQPLENIFTRDITAIIEFVLLGSAIYLIICIFETKYKLKKAEESYFSLKENYNNVLSDIDLEEIFSGDNLINKTTRSVNKGILIYSLLWTGFLIIAFLLVEYIST